MDTEQISTYGRVTKGVRLIRLGDGVSVVTVATVQKEEEAEETEATETEAVSTEE